MRGFPYLCSSSLCLCASVVHQFAGGALARWKPPVRLGLRPPRRFEPKGPAATPSGVTVRLETLPGRPSSLSGCSFLLCDKDSRMSSASNPHDVSSDDLASL